MKDVVNKSANNRLEFPIPDVDSIGPIQSDDSFSIHSPTPPPPPCARMKIQVDYRIGCHYRVLYHIAIDIN